MSNDTSGSIIEPQHVINGPTIHQSDIHFSAITTNVSVLNAKSRETMLFIKLKFEFLSMCLILT